MSPERPLSDDARCEIEQLLAVTPNDPESFVAAVESALS